MSLLKQSTIAVLMALLAIDSQLTAQDVIQGLGDLPDGDFDSRGHAVSPNGDIFVGRGLIEEGGKGFRWTQADGMTQLNGVFNGGTNAHGVSDTGRIVGQSPGLFDSFASYWNADGSINGSLGDFAGGVNLSSANDVSADGNVIVGWGTGVNGSRAFRWTAATGMQDLGLPDNGSLANAVSHDGSTIVGNYVQFGGDTEAFHWRNGVRTYLGDLAGGEFHSQALDVSADGNVVVGSSVTGFHPEGSNINEAFRWTESGGLEGLGQLGDQSFSRATAVSADGSIIVGSAGSYGFVWDPQQGMRSFHDVLTQDFEFNLDDWWELVPIDISADGLTITGYGHSSDSGPSQYQWEAFRISVDARWIRESNGSWEDRSMWALGIDPNELHDIQIRPDAGLTVTKSSGHSTIRSLSLNATNGVATLDLDGGNLTVQNETTILANGRITGSGTFNALGGILNSGVIDLNGGQITGGTLNNFNRVGGDGVIASRLNNTVTGQIRVGSGQHLQLTGPTLANDGLIDVVGGTFEVSRSYSNGGIENTSSLIFARDAALRFNGGLSNYAGIGFSFGTTDIYGDVNNTSFGRINISGGANATFVDDLVQNGVMQVVRVGSHVSSAVIFGAFSGNGGFVGGGDVFALGDLRPGNSPASVLMDGNLFLGPDSHTFIELAGLDSGEYDQLVVTGDLALAGDFTVELIDGFSLELGHEFLIAEINGNLFGQFNGLDEGALVGNLGQNLFITYNAGDGNDIALFTAVPEPSIVTFCGLVLIGLVVFRRSPRFLATNRRRRLSG